MMIDKKGKVLIRPYLYDNGPDPFQEGLARSQQAEYREPWREHTFIEMTQGYVGNPVSGSPYKCMEG